MSNVRLCKDLNWFSALTFDSDFYVNYYKAKVYLTTISTDSFEQNTAYERMKFWTNYILDDCIFVRDNDPALPIWQKTPAKIVVLPEDPVDQIIGIMLYCKLNAIMENKMIVTDIEISSRVGDWTVYLHNHSESEGGAMRSDGWWRDSRPIWSTPSGKVTRNKVVTINRPAEWSDHDLGWTDRAEDQSDSVVFARFPKNEDQ